MQLLYSHMQDKDNEVLFFATERLPTTQDTVIDNIEVKALWCSTVDSTWLLVGERQLVPVTTLCS